MRFIFFLMLSFPALANSFHLSETGARFSLIINSSEARYSSEGLKKHILLKKCNLHLAQELNKELFAKIPDLSGAVGLKYKIDNSEVLIDPASDLGKLILMMDARMLRFIQEEGQSCS
jgi:hypothetical protein